MYIYVNHIIIIYFGKKNIIIIMCLFAFCDNVKTNSKSKSKNCKIFIFQREEYLSRPTLPLNYNFKNFKHCQNIVGGADLVNPPGSWLCINTKTGKIGILTNYRTASSFENDNVGDYDNSNGNCNLVTEPVSNRKKYVGRGKLVIDYCKKHSSEENDIEIEFWKKLISECKDDIYKGFNFIGGSLLPNINFKYFTNQRNNYNSSNSNNYIELKSSCPNEFHIISNSYINDESWPRVAILKKQLQNLFEQSTNDDYCNDNTMFFQDERANDIYLIEKIFSFMSNETEIEDDVLPKTGVKYDWEKNLAKIFVNYKEKNYFSRSCTIVLVKNNNYVVIMERTLCPNTIKIDFKYNAFQFKIGEETMERLFLFENHFNKHYASL